MLEPDILVTGLVDFVSSCPVGEQRDINAGTETFSNGIEPG